MSGEISYAQCVVRFAFVPARARLVKARQVLKMTHRCTGCVGLEWGHEPQPNMFVLVHENVCIYRHVYVYIYIYIYIYIIKEYTRYIEYTKYPNIYEI